ncbi:protein kinase [Ophiocordyceps camponoti-floridani]|uniref:Protein kinase n=1 Tax=Ophiocordyceps camponoti-floridani TaxID=2030778 RepID=A0A8H4VFF0_9HYPO|nr:protein kinase [Ophiocordyceps camponoti-floridani]
MAAWLGRGIPEGCPCVSSTAHAFIPPSETVIMPPYTDTIDALDTIGPRYHHSGPYDAALPSRNINATTSPLAAVHDSNMEALRATPRENVIDALSRNVPLQGVASIPPGETDLSGRVMEYAEGADLMREADSAGGAYKRWPGLNYHPDDLKGKGEPDFTTGKHHGRQSHRLSVPIPSKREKHHGSSHRLSVPVQSKREKHQDKTHRLSLSTTRSKDDNHPHNSRQGKDSTHLGLPPPTTDDAQPQAGLRRSLSTGTARLMRRLGSVRRRKSDDARVVV